MSPSATSVVRLLLKNEVLVLGILPPDAVTDPVAVYHAFRFDGLGNAFRLKPLAVGP